MEVNFRTIVGKTFSIKIQPDKTLLDAKKILTYQEDVNLENAQFIYHAEILPDNTLIKDINIAPDRFIVIHTGIPRKMNPAPPPVNNNDSDVVEIPLPASNINYPTSDEPQDLNEKINRITEIGYSREQALEALRAANFDLETAVNILCSDDAPPAEFPPPNRNPPPPPQSPNRNPSQTSPEELQRLFDSLSPAEKAIVERLKEVGFSFETNIQVFLLSNKNEEQSRQLLLSLRP